nr:DUF3367 domain-containing protein [candidate division Zixibacteria bacterium]
MVSLVFVLPFLINWDYIGVGDWELFATMAAVPQRTVLHYHQFPFWNPYLGGGNILFAHPEVGILSPFFPLILIFGAIGGLKIQMMLAYFLGFWGTWLLAKRLGRSPLASYLAAFVYFGSSYFALHFAIGHVPFTHFCFLPWFLYFLLKTDDDSRFLAGAIAAVALIILGNGAAVPFLYTCFFSGVLLILYAIEEKSLRLIKRFIVAVILGVLLGAVKFFPMFHYLSQNEWEGMPGDFTPINILWKAFFSFDQAVFRQAGSGQYWGWHEYSAYISPLAVILAVAALILAFRKSRAWLVVGLFFFLFGLGHFSDFSPWNLILHIPGFSSIRSPARTFQFVVLATAILSGIGLDVLTARLKSATSVKNALSLSIICLILLTGFLVNLPAMKTIKYKKPAHVAFDEDFRQVIGRRDDIYNLFLKNRGSLVAPWLSAYKESRGLVTPTNEVLMEYVSSGQAGVLTRQYTPNRVDYRLAPALAGTIIFGIGYDDGWRTADGRPLFENNGLVATGFTHNDRQITLLYRPRGFIFGLVVSLLVLAGLSVFIFHGKIRKRLEAIFN